MVDRSLQSVDSWPLQDATVRVQREVSVKYRSVVETAKCRSCFDVNAVRPIRDVVWVTLSMKELLLELDFASGVVDVDDGCLQA